MSETPKPQFKNILEEAEYVVSGPRNQDYGSPLKNHGLTAKLWGDYLGIELTPQQVCYMNMLQKISRSKKRITRDNLVDIAGYARNVEIIEDEIKSRPQKILSVHPPIDDEKQ